MGGLGEEINRGKALGAVALGGQEGKIAGHGFRIAADIDHPFGGHAGHANFLPSSNLLLNLLSRLVEVL